LPGGGAALDDLPGWPSTFGGPPTLRIGIDLADMSGYAYYSGSRFALYADGLNAALARGAV
jgi:ATP phosphoribosyltransferase regulatory subunit